MLREGVGVRMASQQVSRIPSDVLVRHFLHHFRQFVSVDPGRIDHFFDFSPDIRVAVGGWHVHENLAKRKERRNAFRRAFSPGKRQGGRRSAPVDFSSFPLFRWLSSSRGNLWSGLDGGERRSLSRPRRETPRGLLSPASPRILPSAPDGPAKRLPLQESASSSLLVLYFRRAGTGIAPVVTGRQKTKIRWPFSPLNRACSPSWLPRPSLF